MTQLNNCPHCGSATEFVVNKQGMNETVLARCTGCMIQTQPVSSSLGYSAMEKVAGTWNSSSEMEWPDWIQPKGAHDAYAKGAKVSHASKRWVSNIDANVWAPGVTGWTEQKGGAA